MAITDESKEKLKARLSKAIGHLNAVYKMVDDKKYCIDVLNQLKAVQSALDKTAEIMLRDHLNTCVVEAVQHNDSQRVMEELWQLLRRPYAEDDDLLPGTGIVSSAGIATTSGAGGCCSNNKSKTKAT
jgi:CsoR family transcriptional regulator, copper-sensing transcriptional repressor